MAIRKNKQQIGDTDFYTSALNNSAQFASQEEADKHFHELYGSSIVDGTWFPGESLPISKRIINWAKKQLTGKDTEPVITLYFLQATRFPKGCGMTGYYTGDTAGFPESVAEILLNRKDQNGNPFCVRYEELPDIEPVNEEENTMAKRDVVAEIKAEQARYAQENKANPLQPQPSESLPAWTNRLIQTVPKSDWVRIKLLGTLRLSVGAGVIANCSQDIIAYPAPIIDYISGLGIEFEVL